MKLTSFPSQVSCPSPDGNFVLTLDKQALRVDRISHSSGDLSSVRTIPLSQEWTNIRALRWSPISRFLEQSTRFLIATDSVIKVFDLTDDEWSATVKAPRGIGAVHFGEHDYEVMIYDPFKSLLRIQHLYRKEIKDEPADFTNPKAFGARCTRHSLFVLLSRQEAQDVITVHVPRTYENYVSFKPQTVDAQGLKLSPDGQWIAVWESATMGYKILIYTIDGNLYRVYNEDYFDTQLQGLGVKSIEWSPDGHFLAVAGYNGTVKLLSTKKFSAAVELAHPRSVSPDKTAIHLESVVSDAPGGRCYYSPSTKVHLAAAAKGPLITPFGVSELHFNADGTLLATKYDAFPSTVWIWDLASLRPRAILVQHYEIQDLAWHPCNKHWLLVNCAKPWEVVHLWDGSESGGGRTHVIDLALQSHDNSISKASFVRCSRGGKEYVSLFHEMNDGSSNLVWPFERPESSPRLPIIDGPEPTSDLTLGDATLHDDFHTLNGTMQEDTFAFRRGVSAY